MQPEVVEGYRGPRHERRDKTERDTGKVIPTGKRMFQFRKLRYYVQITAPVDRTRPDGTIERGDKPLRVIAEEGFKTLDEVKDAETIKLLEAHPDYCQHPDEGGDFWDFANVLAGQKAKAEDAALKVLQDPVSRQKIIEALRATGDVDFPLPGVKSDGAKAKASDQSASTA